MFILQAVRLVVESTRLGAAEQRLVKVTLNGVPVCQDGFRIPVRHSPSSLSLVAPGGRRISRVAVVEIPL